MPGHPDGEHVPATLSVKVSRCVEIGHTL